MTFASLVRVFCLGAAGASIVLGLAALNLARPLAADEELPADVNKPEIISEGRKVFAQTCGNFECHNFYGGGGLVPDARKINDGQWYHIGGKYEEIVAILTNGIPGTPMISWTNKLGPERIKAVSAYVFLLSRGLAPKN